MIYLKDADLLADSYQVFINTSTQDATEVINDNELRAIEIAKTYLSGRYDIAKVFDATLPIRNELLVDILSKITLYKIFRRNAPRKLPSDIKEDYEWAFKELEKIQRGTVMLTGLPIPVDESGNSTIPTIWGNNSNSNFYI